MRTESSTPTASAATKVRGELVKARHWVSAKGRSTQLILGLLAVVALIAATYYSIPHEREEVVWLYDGRRFSHEYALSIQKALAAEKIAFRADASNRIGVGAVNWSDAIVALEKHSVEPPSLEGLDKEPTQSNSWMMTREEHADVKHRMLERKLKAIIEGYPDIRAADVTISRILVSKTLRPVYQMSGSVVLEAVPRPTHRVIGSIQTLLSSMLPELKPDAVTISDRQGHFYLRAGDPTSISVTQSLAKAEDLRDRLLENLASSIPGIDVVVQVDPPSITDSGTASIPTSKNQKQTPSPPPAIAAEEIKANAPLALEPDELVAVEPAPAPVQTVSVPREGKANVWVKIPRSYYVKSFRENTDGRNPTPQDLQPYADKTRELVQSAIAVLLPSAERGELTVSMIRDDIGANGPLLAGVGSSESKREIPAWVLPVALGAVVGLGLSFILLTGLGMLTRRPETRTPRATVRTGLVVDPPTGAVPGPSERVRDLVKRDPGAAAGVLQRWIGQGEGGTNG
jgi:flagellar biosynthesis/type III secretory pathway M-ring protein FliF/YscJ